MMGCYRWSYVIAGTKLELVVVGAKTYALALLSESFGQKILCRFKLIKSTVTSSILSIFQDFPHLFQIVYGYQYLGLIALCQDFLYKK